MTPFLLLFAALFAGAETLPIPLGLDRYLPAPDFNPLTPAKAALGRELFFWKGLSLDRTVACATCHDPARAFTDNQPLAIGIGGQKADRRSPPILNRAWGRSFFWDGRAETLEQQVLQPILNPKEMGLTLPEAAERLRADAALAAYFRDVFARDPNTDDLALALASYVRTILSGDSPYDRYIAGDSRALSPEQAAGLRLFRGKANCLACHVGPNLTDERFHNTGIGFRDNRWLDRGREDSTRDPAARGAFKTPTLREVARTAPYMHDGSLATLDDVINFYNDGGRSNPALDPEIRPLNLTPAEKRALTAFLGALSGRIQEGWPR